MIIGITLKCIFKKAQDGKIITSISYNFIQWAMAFGRAIGIEVYPKSFGLDK